jgi:cis-L-3-hydroxyproline dehydratase
MGCPLVVQEVGGAEITQAATVHLAHAVPERFLLGTSYPKIGLTTAKGAPKLERGRTWASDAPGLGVTPIPEVVGKPVSVHK